MPGFIQNVFTESDIEYLNNLPEVVEAKALLNSRKVVYFSITLTESIRSTLQERLNLDLSTVSKIPLRWIKGDTPSHIDTGASAFEHTYLVYVNDSEGSFVLGNESYPIEANTAFVFNEGLSHKTEGTGLEPRLLVGPMNELAEPVGSAIYYFSSETNALAVTNQLGVGTSFTVGDPVFGGYTSWRMASNSNGSSPQNVVYTNGDVLISDGNYYMYPNFPCFKEGTKVLCQVDGVEIYQPIETLKVGTLVKTSHHGFKKIEIIASGSIHNPGTQERLEDRLYKCSPAKYPELKEDLYITGQHSILVDTLTETQREQLIVHMGRIFVTDKKYRLIACVDERAEPFIEEGVFNIWHLALENEDVKMNYGIYVNGGLLVETCSINTLKNKSNMQSI
uniref:Hedgehog/Intein (Hint) domain-containing protein n=1 Tax=viral metagenome TaxID=1070528 RepID=A0A6C0DH95_9ZZZZ